MNKNLFISVTILILLSVVNNVFSQNDSIPPVKKMPQNSIKRININYISIQPSVQKRLTNSISASDFMKLAPGSAILSDDFANNSNRTQVNRHENYSTLKINLGFGFGNKQRTSYKSNPLLRLGFELSSGNMFSDEYSNIERVSIDTLTSNNTGETIYIDSLFTSYYKLDYRVTLISINGSLLFRTNPKARISFYSGIGFGVGMSLEKETSIYHDENKDKSYVLSNGRTYDQYDYPFFDFSDIETVSGSNTPIMNYSINVPIGINFKIRKDHKIWKKVYLIIEAEPGINIISIPELGTKTEPYLQIGFGVKYTFN
jgi:hypothetical protein